MTEADQKTGIHILLIHQAFAALNEPGGTRHYEMARNFVRSGHRVTIICSPVSYLTGKRSSLDNRWLTRTEPEPGLVILRAYTYSAIHRSFFHRILSFFSFMFSSFFIGLGVKNVDVIWGTSPPIFQGWTAWLLARLKGVKFLFEIRDLWPAFAIAMGVLKNPLLINLSTWLEKFLYAHADQLVVNSPGFIDFITARGGKEIRLIPNGVDPEMFNPGESGKLFRAQYNLENKFVVLYAGAHGVSNDLEVVLTAARLMLDNQHIVFLLVGDGKEKNHLEELASSWSLNNVRFLPPFAKQDMSLIMAGSDACIAILKQVDLYKTTYPNKVFDYMAAAKPVLCAIDGVIREVIENSRSGLFVTPGDPQSLVKGVLFLSEHPQECKNMGINGRKSVEVNFNRSIISREMETLLVDLAKTPRKSRKILSS